MPECVAENVFIILVNQTVEDKLCHAMLAFPAFLYIEDHCVLQTCSHKHLLNSFKLHVK